MWPRAAYTLHSWKFRTHSIFGVLSCYALFFYWVFSACFHGRFLQSLVRSTSASNPSETLLGMTDGLFAHMWYDTFTTAYVVSSMIPSSIWSSALVQQIAIGQLSILACLLVIL